MRILELQVVLLPEVLGYCAFYCLTILQLQREPKEVKHLNQYKPQIHFHTVLSMSGNSQFHIFIDFKLYKLIDML